MENIEADALRFARFVEQTVALSFFERRRNCVFVERFQFAHGATFKRSRVEAGKNWFSNVTTNASSLQLFNGSTIRLSLQPSPDPTERIIKVVHYAFFQWNNPVIGDLNAFRANLCAALGDVAIADPLAVSQFVSTVFSIQRMHLQRSDVDQKPRSNESFVHLVIA